MPHYIGTCEDMASETWICMYIYQQSSFRNIHSNRHLHMLFPNLMYLVPCNLSRPRLLLYPQIHQMGGQCQDIQLLAIKSCICRSIAENVLLLIKKTRLHIYTVWILWMIWWFDIQSILLCWNLKWSYKIQCIFKVYNMYSNHSVTQCNRISMAKIYISRNISC